MCHWDLSGHKPYTIQKRRITLYYFKLKNVNQECETTHFKMESIKQVIHMIKPNMYLASLDIKDTFYTAPIYEPHIKYLKLVK